MLAPAEHYPTRGVFGWQIKNTDVLSNDAKLFSHQKRIRNFSFLPCDFRPRSKKREARVFGFVSHTNCWVTQHNCRISAAPKPFLSCHYMQPNVGISMQLYTSGSGVISKIYIENMSQDQACRLINHNMAVAN